MFATSLHGEYHVVEMQESARDAKKCEKRRHGDGEVQGMCVEGMCDCHNLKTRRESAPSLPETRHPEHGDHDNEMPDKNDTAADDAMLRDVATLHILGSLRELAKKNMPNTTTFIPHRMRKRFGRVYSSKVE